MRDELRRAWRGASVEPRFVALGETVRRHAIPLQPFDDLGAGLVHGSGRRALPDLRGARALLLPGRRYGRAHDRARRRLPRAAPQALEHAKTLGTADAAHNILRDVGEDLAPRPRLPAGRGPREVRPRRGTARRAARRRPRVRALMEFEIARARRALRSAGSRSSRSSPTARGRLAFQFAVDAYSAILENIRANGYDVFRRTREPLREREARRSSPAPCGARRSSPAATRATVRTATAAAGGTATTDARSERGARPDRRGRPRVPPRAAPPPPRRSSCSARRGTATGAPSSSRTPRSPLSTCSPAGARPRSLRRSGGLVRHLFQHQKADGSWGIATNLAGDVSTTARAISRCACWARREDERLRSRSASSSARAALARCASSRASTSRCSASSRGTRCPRSRRSSSSARPSAR